MNIEKLNQLVEQHQEMILEAERWIWKNPETGYREWKTTTYMEEKMQQLGYHLIKAGNIPGFYTDLQTGRPGPKVCIMGELDSLICQEHPDADPVTQAVHACGHNAQCATLLGVAAVLKQPGVMDGLCGSIRLMAVPAEELIEVEFREELRRQKVIEFFGGKVEFMARGFFKDVDIALLIHTTDGEKTFTMDAGNNGCIVKNITYHGVASHAGGSPHKGVNALYAAMQGLQAVNALRETFQDSDHIRFHPIITKGGQAVNAIPNEVKIESYVRGSSMDAIRQANIRINRALAASAASVGATLSLQDRPGYYPLYNEPKLKEVCYHVLKEIVSEDEIEFTNNWSTGCTDMGDLSSVIATIQPDAKGAVGTFHGKDFMIEDPISACVMSTKALSLLAIRLLENQSELALQVLSQFKPVYVSQEEYCDAARTLFLDKEAVQYNSDGTVILDFQNKTSK